MVGLKYDFITQFLLYNSRRIVVYSIQISIFKKKCWHWYGLQHQLRDLFDLLILGAEDE